MMQRLTIKFKGTAPLLPAASQVQAAGLAIVRRLIGALAVAAVPVAVIVPVVAVRGVAAIVRRVAAQSNLSGAVAVRVCHHRRARVRMRVAHAVLMTRRRLPVVVV